MIKQVVALAVLCAMPFTLMADEDAPMMLMVQRLTMESALTIAQGAVEACRKEGIQIGVTVVDRNGTVQVTLRDTLAPTITLMISRQKAYTAANFNAKTSGLGAQAKTPIGRVQGLLMSDGGVPIQAGGNLLGGVGVSGAPSGKIDEACAQAGLVKIMDDLEMSL
ncbi:GlcG/HbpS family heme-binding protein [Candidatus Vondammii sp. HM_W22]|uniref:GlcG/HbpS family heme-binding protein n=1 Tax=Candidatus Vondammii sp. HM_W22 TaxID=2687299 RepID=UPI001F148BE1|nr:heme-binding protein [Candidatus Vondammii sp. HM_W22]